MAAAKTESNKPDDAEVPLQVTVPRRVKRDLDLFAAGSGRTKRSVVLEALRSVGIMSTDAEVDGRRPRREQKEESASDG